MEASVLPGMLAKLLPPSGSTNCAAKPHFFWVGWAVETPPCISVDVDRY